MTARDGEWDEVYWRALVEASLDVILVVDTTGTILFVNRVVPALASRGVVGQKIWDFAVGDAVTRLREKIEQVVTTQKAVVYENQGFRPDGSPGWYDVRAIPVVLGGKVDRIIWASADISDRKALEEQLRQAQKMEAIGLLAGGVAHDFNNILAVIVSFSDLAMRGVPANHPLGESLREITDAARRGSDLTKRLLAFSRKQHIEPRLLDLGATTIDFAQMIRRVLGTDVELVVEEPTALFAVRADPVQLEQVLMNLCMNARQAMPHGGKLHLSTRAVELEASFVAKNPWARVGSFVDLSVKDNGGGMDAATKARAFEPFFTTKKEGTGLGLSTVHGIVEQHGGFLRIESAVDVGTTIHAYFPKADDPSIPSSRAPRSGRLTPT